MGEKKENKVVATATKILSIIIFITVAIFLFNIAPYFKPTETFKRGVLHLVVDDKDVTNSLPDSVYVEDKLIMMSDKTIMKFFKDIFVYYDSKYDTAIITSNKKVGKIKLSENKININGEDKPLAGTARMSGDSLFIPINLISEVTDVDVEYNQKVIANTPIGKSRMKVAEVKSNHNLKAYKREIALITGVAKKGESLYIFDTEGKNNEDYLTVRDERGNIGYYKYGKINAAPPTSWNQGIEYLKYQMGIRDIKYTLAWEYASYYTPDRSNEKKIDALRIISPTWVEVKNSDADLTNTISRDYIKWAKEQKYLLWPTIKNDVLSMDDLSIIMNDMVLREKLVNNIVEIAIGYEFDGINLDFENMYKADKDVFSQFIRELSAALRANNIISSVDVSVAGGSDTYSLCYDRTAIAKAADYVMLMAYDQYGTWSKVAGPTASLSWVESNIKEMLGYEQVPKEKIFLCIPFFYNSWIVDKETDKAISKTEPFIKNAVNDLATYKNNAVWDEDAGQYYIEADLNNGTLKKIWIENEDSIKEKIKLVNEYDLAGIAIWRLGYENGNSTWKAISDTLKEE